jgi:hypothetical protein
MFRDLPWSKSEKTIAREAFDKAYKREVNSIVVEVKKMVDKISDPKDIWRIHNYLSEQRRQTDEKYDYRYSVLLLVFARLIEDKWLTEADLHGLREDKLQAIRTMLDLRPDED